MRSHVVSKVFTTNPLLLILISILVFGSSVVPAHAATYYIDFEAGANANPGTTKTAPLKHAPGMQGCTGVCAGISPQPGDRFIFKGGVTWDHTAFQMVFDSNGTAANPIYFGVDESWFSGSVWHRPIFDGEHLALASEDTLLLFYNRSYITLDNIELKRLTAPSNWGPSIINLVCSNHIRMTRLYVHDWRLAASVAKDDAHGGIFANNWGGCNPAGNVIDQSVISNVEAADAGRQNGVAVRSVDIQHSVIHDVSTSQLFGRVHSSRIFNVGYPAKNYTFDPAYHTNTTYIQHWNGDVDPEIEPAYIYNNVIYDFNAGSGGLYVNNCSDARSATYMWNNVIYNNFSGGNSNVQIEPDQSPVGCGVFYIWNNTLQIPNSTEASAVRVVGGTNRVEIGTLVMKNNHFIASSVFAAPLGVQNLTDAFNVTHSNAIATSEGFLLTQQYAFSPTSASSSVASGGENLTSECVSGRSALCSDTSYAVGFNAANNTVIMPARTSNPRPTSGSWGIGAYQFASGGSAAPPAPPSNLRIQ